MTDAQIAPPSNDERTPMSTATKPATPAEAALGRLFNYNANPSGEEAEKDRVVVLNAVVERDDLRRKLRDFATDRCQNRKAAGGHPVYGSDEEDCGDCDICLKGDWAREILDNA